MISTGITLGIVVLVLVLPTLLGFGGPASTPSPPPTPQGRAIAERAVALEDEFDVKLTVTDDASTADVTLDGGEIQSDEQPDDALVNMLQVANQQLDADAKPPLRVVTTEPVDPDRDAKAGLAFFVDPDPLRPAADLRLLGRDRRRGGEGVAGDRDPAGHDQPEAAAGGQGDRARPARPRPAADRVRVRARGGERDRRAGRRRATSWSRSRSRSAGSCSATPSTRPPTPRRARWCRARRRSRARRRR